MKPIALLLVLIAAISGTVSAEQVYAWVDATGVRHFSDSPPPPGVTNAKRLTIHGGTAATTSEPARQDSANADAGNPPQAGKPLEDSPENRATACRTARGNLELLQSKYRISMPVDAGGKPQELDAEQRSLEVSRAQDQVSFYCKQG